MMKNTILTAVFCILGLAVVQAQNNIVNNTRCDATVEAFCYDISTCVQSAPCTTVTVYGNTSTTPLPSCGCTGNTRQAYRVRWNYFACNSITASVGTDFPPFCPLLPMSQTLAPCNSNCCNNTMGYMVQYAQGTNQLFIN